MSNTVIQLKRSSATGNIPSVGDINHGELAINYADGKLFFKTASNQIDSIYTPNQYETINVNNTLLIPTTPTDILTLNSANGIKLTACSVNETIIIDETLSPIINLVYSTANAAFDKANTGSGITQTASNTAPANPALGDEWYKIDTDVLYKYTSDDSSDFWLDITSAKITANSTQLTQNVTGDLVVSGNVTGGNLVTSNAVTSGTLAVSSSANIGTNLGVTGNVTASYFIGDGSQLTGITAGGGGGNIYSNSYILTATTTNSTETEAYINGVAGTRIPVNTNKTIYYTADLACRRTDSTGDHAAWYIKGVATNASGTVTDIGSLYEIIVARTDANFLVDFRADDANNSLGVYLTGASGKTVSWRCVVNVLEI
jgi:hypothetical protein